jgi:hypothetical protein
MPLEPTDILNVPDKPGNPTPLLNENYGVIRELLPTSGEKAKLDELATLSAFISTLLNDADAAAARATLGLDKEPVPFFFSGKLLSSQTVKYVAGRPFTLPQNLTGAQSDAGTNATSSTTIDIQKKIAGVWTSIGSAVFTNAGATCTFNFASAVSVAAGEALRLVAPASPDATLANVAITLLGTLT